MPKKSTKNATSTTNTKVTRITAKDNANTVSAKVKKNTTAKVKPAIDHKKTDAKEKSEKRQKRNRLNPLAPIGRYFKESWGELMQVRWPDRKSTWGMTLALIGFTVFFVVLIVLFDFGFNELFKLILGSN